MTTKFKMFNKIDTVHGKCEECEEDVILLQLFQIFIDVLIVDMIQNNISMVQLDI